MKGKLYGIGTGPGDPELLTLKAVQTIQRCAVLAIPRHSGEEQTALNIIAEYIRDSELMDCYFAMSRDYNERIAARQTAAEQIIQRLDIGQDVGFITLGDPTTFSTYMYVHEIVATLGYETEIIPGVTSFAAAAAALGTAQCVGDETLTIIPARHSRQIGELLDAPGNKVIMKSGENLLAVLRELQQRGYNQQTMVVCRATMSGQRLYRSIDEYLDDPDTGYFTVAIVKENEG